MTIQAIIMDKNKYTLAQAKKYIRDHKYKPIKEVHVTESYYRFRLVIPNYKKYTYRTIDLSNGIKAIVQIPKN